MSAAKFLDKLEQTGLLDDKVLATLRKQVASSKKRVSPQAVAKILIQKGHLTSKQAKKMLEGFGGTSSTAQPKQAPTAPPEEELQPLEDLQPLEELTPIDDTPGLVDDLEPLDDTPGLQELEPLDDTGGLEPLDGGLTPLEDDGGLTPLDDGGLTPLDDTGGLTPLDDSGGLTPLDDSGGLTPLDDTGGLTPLDDTGGLTPLDDTGGLTPLGSSSADSSGLTPLGGSDGLTPIDSPTSTATAEQPKSKGAKSAVSETVSLLTEKPVRTSVWDSKLLLLGSGALVLLLFVGGLLYWFLTSQPADELFNAAEEAYAQQSYGAPSTNLNDI